MLHIRYKNHMKGNIKSVNIYDCKLEIIDWLSGILSMIYWKCLRDDAVVYEI